MSSWKERLATLVRFGLVGAANTVLAYGIYAGLVFLGMHYAFALVFDYAFAIGFSLVMNKTFTFRETGPITGKQVWRMVGTYAVLFVVNTAMIALLIDVWRLNVYFSQALVTVLIAGCSFVLQRFAVFRTESK